MKKDGVTQKGTMLDLFLVLLLFLCVAGGVFRWIDMKSSQAPKVEQQFLLEFYSDGIDSMIVDCLQEGEVLYQNDGSTVGILVGVKQVPLSVSLISGGEEVAGTWGSDRKCRIHITARCDGTVRDGMLLLGGKTPLGIGEKIILRSRGSELYYRLYQYHPAS